MDFLFTAIFNRYNDASAESIALRAALINGLHFPRAAQKTAFPYAVLSLVSCVPNDKFVEEYDNAVIQFNLFSDKVESSAEICNLYNKLDNVYNKCTLEIDGYIHISMLRIFSELLSPSDDNIQQFSIQYRIIVEKK